LVTMSSVYTDAVTREQVSHSGRIPELETGARQVISKQATQEVRDFITDLAWRGAHFDPKRPDFDNSLKVSNDGRNVSMDERMANLDVPLDGAGWTWWPPRWRGCGRSTGTPSTPTTPGHRSHYRVG